MKTKDGQGVAVRDQTIKLCKAGMAETEGFEPSIPF